MKVLYFVFSRAVCVFSGSAALSTATVMETLFKSCHIVYSERPSLSLCGNIKLNTRTASVKRLALLPKKGKSHHWGPEGSVLIYRLNLGPELWPRRYLGGLIWRMKSSGNAEWIWSLVGEALWETGQDRRCLTIRVRILKLGGRNRIKIQKTDENAASQASRSSTFYGNPFQIHQQEGSKEHHVLLSPSHHHSCCAM